MTKGLMGISRNRSIELPHWDEMKIPAVGENICVHAILSNLLGTIKRFCCNVSSQRLHDHQTHPIGCHIRHLHVYTCHDRCILQLAEGIFAWFLDKTNYGFCFDLVHQSPGITASTPCTQFAVCNIKIQRSMLIHDSPLQGCTIVLLKWWWVQSRASKSSLQRSLFQETPDVDINRFVLLYPLLHWYSDWHKISILFFQVKRTGRDFLLAQVGCSNEWCWCLCLTRHSRWYLYKFEGFRCMGTLHWMFFVICNW